MRFFILFSFLIFLFACGGVDESSVLNALPIENNASNNNIQSKSENQNNSADIDLSNGIPEQMANSYWLLDKPVTLNLLTLTDEQNQLSDDATAYNQKLDSRKNVFNIDRQGVITVYTLFESKVRDISGNINIVSCLDKQPKIEEWFHINENRFRASNNSQEIDFELSLNESTLSIKQLHGVIIYKRVDAFAEDLLNYESCVSLSSKAKTTALNILKSNPIFSLSDLKGVWRMHNKLQSFGIAFSDNQLPNTQSQYISYDETGSGEIWLLNEKRSCFYHSNKFFFEMELDGAFIRESLLPYNIFLQRYRAFKPNIITKDDMFGESNPKTPFLYLEYISPLISELSDNFELTDLKIGPNNSSPDFFELTDIEIGPNNTCKEFENFSTELSDKLWPTYSIKGVEGIWSIPVDLQSNDLQYLHITDDGQLIHYDYRGDTFNNGIHCYQEIKRSTVRQNAGNNYEEVSSSFINTIFIFRYKKGGDLLIRSLNEFDDHYNRRLQKADKVEESGGIYPICPRVRN